MERFPTSRTPAAGGEVRPADADDRRNIVDAGLPGIAAGVGAIALAPLAVVALRLFDPLHPASSAAPWLPSAAAGGAALIAAGAMLLAVARGLREVSPPALLRGGALGAVATGLTLAAVQDGLSPASFPDPGLSACAIAAGVLLVAAGIVPARMARDRDRLVASVVLIFVLLEGTLAAALFFAPSPSVATWLLAAAAGLVAISAVPGPWLAAGLTASGFAALAAARVGSLEALAGVLALAAGAAAYAGSARRERRVSGPAVEPRQPGPLVPILPSEPAEPAQPLLDRAAGAVAGATDEATRLAHELRGTIAELLQARRTVELQRDEILRLETQDPLTGLASRRAILDRLRVEAAEARRYAHPVAVLLLDIDGFTTLNHDHGMGVADEVLREIALRLRLRTRSADALGRMGADSFLMLLPHTDETGAATFADALIERLLARPVETYDGELSLAVSIGVAFMRPGMSLGDQDLLAEAEAALASARAAGGNRIAFDRMHGLLRLDDRRHPGQPDDEGRSADRA